jgi:LmbE family N-acetylglucosaminyl deacetylase
MKILILCPHTDDEFGCAGTIRKLSEKHQIKYIAFSRCEESVPRGYPKNILEDECMECTKRLNINIASVLGYTVRHFPVYRQKILEYMVTINKEYKPNLVFMPSSTDTHQDHAVIFQEGFRAFKKTSILGYELPQNLVTFRNTAFVKLTKNHINNKIFALSAYKTQKPRSYASPEFIYGLAKVRGVQCDAEYAEAFEVIRLII